MLAIPEPRQQAPARTGLRAVLVRVHRYFGLAIAAFLIVAGVTGSALVFQHELDAALNPGLWRAERAGPPLSPQAIADRVAAADPRVTARWIPLDPAPRAAADIWVDWRGGAPRRYDQMFVDPTTGAVNGTRAYGAARVDPPHLVPFLHTLHKSLFLPGNAGAILLGIVALLWIADSVVGWALTLPRRPAWRTWMASWRVKRHASPTRRTFDLHRAAGLWLWPLLILMGVSSLALTLPHEVFEPAVARFSPLSPEPWDDRPAQAGAPGLDFDAALARGTRAARGAGVTAASSGVYHAPEASLYGVRFGREDAGTPAWVYLDSRTGGILRVETPGSGTAGDAIRRAQLPIHAGRIGGLATRVLTSLLGLLIAALAVTGVLIWHRKRRARGVRRTREAAA